jgi:hypothetical protein
MKESDVWRLPLVEPYELITAYCCQSWSYQPAGFLENFTADSVNYAKGYILYYGYPGRYGFLNTHQQRVIRVATYRVFVDSVAAKGFPTTLYKTEIVYWDWVKTGQLPWANEILATERTRR